MLQRGAGVTTSDNQETHQQKHNRIAAHLASTASAALTGGKKDLLMGKMHNKKIKENLQDVKGELPTLVKTLAELYTVSFPDRKDLDTIKPFRDAYDDAFKFIHTSVAISIKSSHLAADLERSQAEAKAANETLANEKQKRLQLEAELTKLKTELEENQKALADKTKEANDFSKLYREKMAAPAEPAPVTKPATPAQQINMPSAMPQMTGAHGRRMSYAAGTPREYEKVTRSRNQSQVPATPSLFGAPLLANGSPSTDLKARFESRFSLQCLDLLEHLQREINKNDDSSPAMEAFRYEFLKRYCDLSKKLITSRVIADELKTQDQFSGLTLPVIDSKDETRDARLAKWQGDQEQCYRLVYQAYNSGHFTGQSSARYAIDYDVMRISGGDIAELLASRFSAECQGVLQTLQEPDYMLGDNASLWKEFRFEYLKQYCDIKNTQATTHSIISALLKLQKFSNLEFTVAESKAEERVSRLKGWKSQEECYRFLSLAYKSYFEAQDSRYASEFDALKKLEADRRTEEKTAAKGALKAPGAGVGVPPGTVRLGARPVLNAGAGAPTVSRLGRR